MKNNKFLFLDIDNTLCNRNIRLSTYENYPDYYHDEIHIFDNDLTIFRPHLKEFLNFVFDKFGIENVGLFTASTSIGMSNFIRGLISNKFITNEQAMGLRLNGCNSDNTPIVMHDIPNTMISCEIKDFERASKNVYCNVEDIILIDDWADKDHPRFNQIIRIPFYIGEQDDTELLKMIKELKKIKT